MLGELTMAGELADWVVAPGGVGGGGGHQVSRVLDLSGTKSTNSTSWVDIDAACLSITMTSEASWVMLGIAGTMQSQQAAMQSYLDFTADGTRLGGSWGTVTRYWATSGARESVSLVVPVQVAAGTHTFRPQWKVSAGGLYLYAESGYTPAIFFAIEMR